MSEQPGIERFVPLIGEPVTLSTGETITLLRVETDPAMPFLEFDRIIPHVGDVGHALEKALVKRGLVL